MTKLLYLHGLGDQPGGSLPTHLQALGWEIVEPMLPDLDFEAAVAMAQADFDRHQPSVVVGYSQGGATAMNIQTGATPLVLISPAWKFRGQAKIVKHQCIVINPSHDELVPLSDVRSLLVDSGLDVEDHLIQAGTEHGVFCEEVLSAVEQAIARLLVT